MKIKQLICLLTLSAPFITNADTLSVTIGGGAWDSNPDGGFNKTKDPDEVDVKDDLFWDSKTQGYAFAIFEHPVPALPNVKLAYTKLDQSGDGNASFVFDGGVYNGIVKNDFSLESTSLIAYYEVLDNIVSIDLGIDIRYVKADYYVREELTTTSSNDSFKQVVPMVYALVGASPYPGLLISGEISYITYQGSDVSDMTAKISYTSDYFVGVEAGYRKQNYNFDDVSNIDSNISFDGAFAGAFVKF